LHEGRREPDVELARPHPDGERREEVPRLVDEHEEGEPQDGDDEAHTGWSAVSAIRLACASAAVSSSRSAAESPEAVASVRSTVSAIPSKPMRPSREAATATSLAPLNAHGYVPRRSPGSGASGRVGHVAASG